MNEIKNINDYLKIKKEEILGILKEHSKKLGIKIDYQITKYHNEWLIIYTDLSEDGFWKINCSLNSYENTVKEFYQAVLIINCGKLLDKWTLKKLTLSWSDESLKSTPWLPLRKKLYID